MKTQELTELAETFKKEGKLTFYSKESERDFAETDWSDIPSCLLDEHEKSCERLNIERF